MSGWRLVTAVPGNFALEIGGLNPWEHEWRRVKDAVAHVTDPEYGRRYGNARL